MNSVLKHKSYLYLTEFFAGMAVMAVELGASRLMAPYFSSSQIVWTIIIATIMIAMALGNIYGGRSADKDPNPDKLYRRLLIAAVWIAAIPVLGKYLILAITGVLVVAVDQNLLIWAAFLACLVIFVYPCFLLGTCTPSLARYVVTGADDSGRTVGTLGAFNTVGSILGTFLPTFVTIPAVGTAITFLIFSCGLLVLALVYFVSRRTHWKGCMTAVVLFIACTLAGGSSFAFWEQDLTYEGESVYNYLQVRETKDSVILSTNVLFGVQSVMMKSDSLTGMYYDYAMAAPIFSAAHKANAAAPTTQSDITLPEVDEAAIQNQSMLILGMGTGTYARQCRNYFGDLKIKGVEIDEKITTLAKTYFDEPASVEVTAYDGRAYLNADPEQYDVIMVDAYQDITIPFQMSSVEFFTAVKKHLAPGGVMVVNMNMRTSESDSINVWLCDTIASVFSNVITVNVSGSTNAELFASEEMLSGDLLLTASAKLSRTDLRDLMEQMSGRVITYLGGEHILTDDKAPVELLGMRAIDELIRDELSYYREIFKTEGISGILSVM